MFAFLQSEREHLKCYNPPPRNPPYDKPTQYAPSLLMHDANQEEEEQMSFVMTDPSVSLPIGALMLNSMPSFPNLLCLIHVWSDGVLLKDRRCLEASTSSSHHVSVVVSHALNLWGQESLIGKSPGLQLWASWLYR